MKKKNSWGTPSSSVMHPYVLKKMKDVKIFFQYIFKIIKACSFLEKTI